MESVQKILKVNMKEEIVLANKMLSRIQYGKLPYRKQKRYCGDTNEIVAVVFTLNSLQTLNLAMEICLTKVKKVIALPAITCSNSPIKNKM